MEKGTEQFDLNTMNWELLRQQKQNMVDLADLDLEALFPGRNMVASIGGIINLLKCLQDYHDNSIVIQEGSDAEIKQFDLNSIDWKWLFRKRKQNLVNCCSSCAESRRREMEAEMAKKAAWDAAMPPEQWTGSGVCALAEQLYMRQHYVKTARPSVDKYKKMVDDQIARRLDKIVRLEGNWRDRLFSPTELLEPPSTKGRPFYQSLAGETGRVKRIVIMKYEFDIEEMHMPGFPTPFEMGAALVREINPQDPGLSTNCRPDSKGFYHVSNVECAIKVDAYMGEMILYLYAVDFQERGK
jgi:hypothetical protein